MPDDSSAPESGSPPRQRWAATSSSISTGSGSTGAYHATGVRVRDLPIRVEDLLQSKVA